MSEAYVGEVRLFAGTFAPVGWADCNGQLLSIDEYYTLYALIGTAYGGDGQVNFGVPDLRGRVPVGQGQLRGSGSNYPLAQSGGLEQVGLSVNQLPAHTHVAVTASTGQVASPAGAIFATAQSSQPGVRIHSTNTGTTTSLSPASIVPTGGSQPHQNMQPFVAIRYIICTDGIYPSQS